jgi:hypothetical protein
MCVAGLPALRNAGAGEPWTLRSYVGEDGKACSFSRMDRGRTFVVTLAFTKYYADLGVVGVAFDEPKLVAATKGSAKVTLKFDNGKSESTLIEESVDGLLMVPIATAKLTDTLQNFWESKGLIVETSVGSASFDLEGFADHIPALRDCASS